ncbi:Crp/Fnr family transcriptional regulator [Bacteroidia bacterium]|nr:Crp/Fnr family transcriptional regulator [Bacteroidia bacterium]
MAIIERIRTANDTPTCSCTALQKKQVIYVEGEQPTHLICLLKGKVKIFKDGVSDRRQIIRMIRPIQYFAYRAYFAHENYLTSAAAFEPCTICLIPMTTIVEIMKHNFQVCRFFIHQLSLDLGIADERVVNLTQKHIRGRLAESLISLIDSYGLEEDDSINIYLSRGDLANHSNMTTANVIRTLSMFVTEKIIALDGRKIKVFDAERLKKISALGR